ncbi:hypothetical protein [Mycolicibacterium aubagnense]|uniref:Uncharacterized protein n=1 Tax=Mycolicibacterium aubagnense TaxID=319707 RepID=A0ABM7IN30_9MYCO|nr:hypothetical protein [Mycolicibacterium aubagnense]TLH62351.1 hypothetical protein C1S80_15205 [Mycolicibacterium aubagnense]BBX88199.1 hypothetical protein MAUB_64000 [Mycolicibacterium aubagnense]
MTPRPPLDVTANLPALLLGLRWLYDTEQPATATQNPRGQHLHTPAGRTLHFIPAGTAGHALLVIVADALEAAPNGHPAANTLSPGELAAFADLLEDLGEPVLSTYNGYPGTTAALALSRPAHPTLLAAVTRFTDRPHLHHLDDACFCFWYLGQTEGTVGLAELSQHAHAYRSETTALTAAARNYLTTSGPAPNAQGPSRVARQRRRHSIRRTSHDGPTTQRSDRTCHRNPPSSGQRNCPDSPRKEQS